MAVIILRRDAVTLAVLIAALLFVLVLQFFGSSEFFLTDGALRINGFEKPGEGCKTVPEAPLYVSANGMTFFIDRKSAENFAKSFLIIYASLWQSAKLRRFSAETLTPRTQIRAQSAWGSSMQGGIYDSRRAGRFSH